MDQIDVMQQMIRGVESESVQLRPSVLAFAQMMEMTLRRHESKKGNQNGANGRRGWRQDLLEDLMDHLECEVAELRVEIDKVATSSACAIGCEAIDVANMAMMVWDRAMRLRAATDPT